MSQIFQDQVSIQNTNQIPETTILLNGRGEHAIFGVFKEGHIISLISPQSFNIGKRLGNSPDVGQTSSLLSIGDKAASGGIDIIGNNGLSAMSFMGNGTITINDHTNRPRIKLNGENGTIELLANNEVRIRLDSTSGDIELLGADCAEEFEIEGEKSFMPAGSVTIFSDTGGLMLSAKPYDKRVAGIISGAGAYRPGIVLNKGGAPISVGNIKDRLPLALSGRAYCKVDASFGAIEVGDLLTSSATLGHAMKVSDPTKAFGAVIGKALQPVPSGCGLIPVLVSLQ